MNVNASEYLHPWIHLAVMDESIPAASASLIPSVYLQVVWSPDAAAAHSPRPSDALVVTMAAGV